MMRGLYQNVSGGKISMNEMFLLGKIAHTLQWGIRLEYRWIWYEQFIEKWKFLRRDVPVQRGNSQTKGKYSSKSGNLHEGIFPYKREIPLKGYSHTRWKLSDIENFPHVTRYKIVEKTLVNSFNSTMETVKYEYNIHSRTFRMRLNLNKLYIYLCYLQTPVQYILWTDIIFIVANVFQ